jgi:nicotinamide-nucleotide amidase
MVELKELMLRSPRWTLAVAESLTAGHVQARVAAISGASTFFRGGVTAYSIEEKVKLLGIDRAAAMRVNCVSAEIAEQMARGVCALFDSDVGVATTGYAEPSAVDAVAMPFAWWAVAVRSHASGRSAGETIRPLPHARSYEGGGTVKGVRGGADFLVRHGRVECPGAGRVEAQAIVAEAVVAELIAFLRERRG